MWLAFLDLVERLRGRRPVDPAAVRARLLAIAGLDSADPVPLTTSPSAGQTDPPRELAPEEATVPTVRAVPALVAVGIVAVVLAGFFVWRAQGGQVAPVTLDPGMPVEVSGTPGSRPSTEAPVLVVQVLGEVRRPGVVRVPAGSRVVDVVAAAGGLRKGGSSGLLNLARKVTDGELIVVGPEAGSDPGTPPGGTSSALVDLNTADEAALDALPGVGPVTAAAILSWRTEHGGFTSVEQLREVDGIGPKTYEKLAPLVTAGSG